MSKYQELVGYIEKTDQLYNVLKRKLQDEFVMVLVNYLECNPDTIIVEYESPNYYEQNDMIIWKFNLVIQVRLFDQTVPIKLTGFSLNTFKKTALGCNLDIVYTGAGHGATTEDICYAIFQKVKKAIDKAAWL